MSHVSDQPATGVLDDLALYTDIYRRMLLIRGFEDLVQSLFLAGEVYGTTHLYSGQEAIATGVASVLEERDRVAATYRGHGHALAVGVDPQKLLDARDPRNRNLFLLSDGETDIDRLKHAQAMGAPTVSGSMATAVLAYSGIAVKMLVDQRLDAQLHTMFMVDYQPGACANPHDHPFEESYYMLDGEVDVVADGDRYALRPGDVFWTAAGCVHAFYETHGRTVRWLETSAPGPPARYSYRHQRDWAYLGERLASDPVGAA